MSKKILIPIVAAIVAALFAGLWLTANAFAQGEQPGKPGNLANRLRKARPMLGQVTAVQDQQFTIEKRDGDEVTFAINEDTLFRGRDKTELTYAEVKIGGWVAVAAPRQAEDTPTARLVIVLPEDFDPENLPERHAGEIIEVDAGAGTLTLKTVRGKEELTYTVDESTRFRSKDDAIQGLDDVQTGMVGLVVSKPAETAGAIPLATMIAAGDKEDLPKSGQRPGQGVRGALRDRLQKIMQQYEKRLGGKVVSIERNAISIEDRDGQQYTLQVTDDTTFRSRGDQVTSLEDLEEGMPVLVGAKDLGNGQLQAQLVLVIVPKK